MSAVLVRQSNDNQTLPWLQEIIRDIGQPQITHLHFRSLRDQKKGIVCRRIAALPVRLFVVLSHKGNMRNYRNINAEMAKVNRTAWFFCWLSRLLLERVTKYCAYRTRKESARSSCVKIVFSDRGGVKIDDVKSYYSYLSNQSRMGILYINQYNLDWNAFDVNQVFSAPNKMLAGLQLADSVASAFYQGVERTAEGILKPEFAKMLRPRLCPRPYSRNQYGFGLKVMPTWISSRLPPDQRTLLDFYM